MILDGGWFTNRDAGIGKPGKPPDLPKFAVQVVKFTYMVLPVNCLNERKKKEMPNRLASKNFIPTPLSLIAFT